MGRAVFSKPDSHFVVTVHASPGSLVEVCLIGEDEAQVRLCLTPTGARVLADYFRVAAKSARERKPISMPMTLPKIRVMTVEVDGNVRVRAEAVTELDSRASRAWSADEALAISDSLTQAASFSESGMPDEDDDDEPDWDDED